MDLKMVRSSLPLVWLVVALLALRWTVVEPYVVPTGSMEPTLKTGDRLYALKCAYDVRFPFTDFILFRVRDVKRGDVILFKAPHDPAITYVKRAVGLPGDRISLHDGKLFVNGEPMPKTLSENRELLYDIHDKENKDLYIETLTGVRHWTILEQNLSPIEAEGKGREFQEVIVPEGQIFAVGDNRDNSFDSRLWARTGGPTFVPYEYLKGKAMFIWFSSWDWRIRPERIGTLLQ